MFEMIRKKFGVVFGIVKRIKILIINNWINVIIIIIGIIWVFYSSNSSLNDNYFYASFADIISQTIIAPSSLPLGFVVAFIGAPYYIYLIQKV